MSVVRGQRVKGVVSTVCVFLENCSSCKSERSLEDGESRGLCSCAMERIGHGTCISPRRNKKAVLTVFLGGVFRSRTGEISLIFTY